MRAVIAGRSRREIAGRIAGLKLERAETRLQRFASQARGLAARLGKVHLEVEVESNRLRLSGEALGPFWASFAHVVRNAVDHGVEFPEERATAGKPPIARLLLRVSRADDRVVVEVIDDGRGVDWAAVSDRAVSLALPHESRSDLVAALFHDGLTTRGDVSDVSGRGVGLGAARGECERLGGTVGVTSEPGRGATFRFAFPGASVMTLDADVRDLLRGEATPGDFPTSEPWEVALAAEYRA